MLTLICGIALGLILGATAAAVGLRRNRTAEPATPKPAAAQDGGARTGDLSLLTAGLAHEIKNPLSTLQLNLQLLREDLQVQSAARPGESAKVERMIRRVASVHNEAGRLREILDDFLRYAGRLEVDARPVDLAATLEDLVDFLAPQAQLARVTLATDFATPLPPARADVRLVKQAVLNLLLNAIQHSDEGGRVTLSLRRGESGAIRVEVRDAGHGIAADQIGRVFEPYFSRRKGGTGLGLPLTRRIVEAHGGTLRVDSAVGRGSTFSFDLPADDEPAAAAAESVPARRRASVRNGPSDDALADLTADVA